MSWRPRFSRPSLPAGIVCFVLAVFQAAPAFAVQEHGGEGMVAHQLGHLLLIAGCFFLFRHSRRFVAAPGWRQFRLFLFLLAGWNLSAFAGHGLDSVVLAEQFLIHGGRKISFLLTDLPDFLYYASRFDHLILLPAFLFLLSAINHWRRQS